MLSRVSALLYWGLSKLKDDGLVILKEVKMVFVGISSGN